MLEHPKAYWRWLAARCLVLGSLIGVRVRDRGAVRRRRRLHLERDRVGLRAGRAPADGRATHRRLARHPVPLHLRSLRWRWQHRRAWLTHLRWAVLVLAPFIFVPLIGVAILTPGVEVARSMKVPGQRLTAVNSASRPRIACTTAVVAAALGIWVARRLLAWRTSQLAVYLASTERGWPERPPTGCRVGAHDVGGARSSRRLSKVRCDTFCRQSDELASDQSSALDRIWT